MRRLAPAFALFFLAPLVAEFFLGDFPITYLGVLFALAPLYGGGALLIREVTRRAGRGWPSILLLALAFGVLEEGLLTQSLFNPDYVNAHLLDEGFVPALGIAIPWTIFVLTLHTVWSIGTPVALVEEATVSRREQPWTRTPGLIAASTLFVVGCVVTFQFTYSDSHFLASPAQLAVSGLVVVALVTVALVLPRRPDNAEAAPAGRGVPAAWTVFAGALAAGAVFMLVDELVPWQIGVVVVPVMLAAVIVCVLRWSGRPGWGPWHRLALAAGAVLTYTWHAFTMGSVKGGNPTIDLVSHVIFALAAIGILGVVARRVATASPSHHTPQIHESDA
jgi:hypothetical protein